jgi:plastocyanin
MRFVPIGASVVTALLVTALAATSLWPNGSLAEAEEPQIIDISVIGPPYQWSPTNYTIFAGTTVKWTASGAAP